MAWIQQKVGEGHSPEVLRAALGKVASGGAEVLSPSAAGGGGAVLGGGGPRAYGLPKHAHSAAADPRLREPLMSKDAVTSAWGWYSGSLVEPAVSLANATACVPGTVPLTQQRSAIHRVCPQM